jgi:hypothetical protein
LLDVAVRRAVGVGNRVGRPRNLDPLEYYFRWYMWDPDDVAIGYYNWRTGLRYRVSRWLPEWFMVRDDILGMLGELAKLRGQIDRTPSRYEQNMDLNAVPPSFLTSVLRMALKTLSLVRYKVLRNPKMERYWFKFLDFNMLHTCHPVPSIIDWDLDNIYEGQYYPRLIVKFICKTPLGDVMTTVVLGCYYYPGGVEKCFLDASVRIPPPGNT